MKQIPHLLSIIFFIGLPIKADLGPIRFGGDSTAIIATCTITQPGNYRLSRDITGVIVIDADNVNLDLETHKITANGFGITVASHRNIEISNGIIQNASNAAMFVNTCSDVRVTNFDILKSTTGLFAVTTTNIQINAFNFEENTVRGIVFDNVNNSSIQNSSILFNTLIDTALDSIVVEFKNSNNITCNNTRFDNNTLTSLSSLTNQVIKNLSCHSCSYIDCTFNNNTFGTDILGSTVHRVSSSSNIYFLRCQMNNNVGIGNVLFFDVVNNGVVEKVVFNENSHQTNFNVNILFLSAGFQNHVIDCHVNQNKAAGPIVVQAGRDTIFTRCEASGNTTVPSGFTISAFGTGQSLKTIFDSCIATDNTATTSSWGFSITDETNGCLLNCVSKRNTGAFGIGYELRHTTSCMVINNIALSNGTTGFLVINEPATPGTSTLSSSLFGNKAEGHQSNYTIIPNTILTTTYHLSTATLSSSPSPHTELHNVDIQP